MLYVILQYLRIHPIIIHPSIMAVGSRLDGHKARSVVSFVCPHTLDHAGPPSMGVVGLAHFF